MFSDLLLLEGRLIIFLILFWILEIDIKLLITESELVLELYIDCV